MTKQLITPHNNCARSPSNLSLTMTTVPCLGSMIRIRLSLLVVANRLPSLFHAIEKMVSLCTDMMLTGSAVSVFHTMHCKEMSVNQHFAQHKSCKATPLLNQEQQTSTVVSKMVIFLGTVDIRNKILQLYGFTKVHLIKSCWFALTRRMKKLQLWYDILGTNLRVMC